MKGRNLEGESAVRGDVEGGVLHEGEEVVDARRLEDDAREGLALGALAKHRPAHERRLLVLVAAHTHRSQITDGLSYLILQWGRRRTQKVLVYALALYYSERTILRGLF